MNGQPEDVMSNTIGAIDLLQVKYLTVTMRRVFISL